MNCGRVFTFCCVFDKDVDACFSCERTGSCFCCVFDKRTQPGRRKIWQEGWDNKYMIWQVGGGLAGMDGVSRIAGIAGWDGGAKHFYGFFCPPEGTFEHYQHFYIAEHAIMKNTAVFAGYALRFPCAGIGRAPVFGENAVRKFLLQNKKQRNPIVTSYSARIPLRSLKLANLMLWTRV